MKRIFYLLVPAIILASCGGEMTPAEKLTKLKKERAALDAEIKKLEAGKKEAGKVTPVTVMAVTAQTFNGNIEVQSVISGDENVVASPQAPGTVKSISVSIGQRVSKGQLLATLDASALDQQIAAQTPNLALTKSLYEKQKSLWDQKIGSEVQLLSAKTNYESVQRQIDAMKAQRDMYRIVAPVSGTVDEVSLKVGEVASPGGIFGGVRIVNYDKLKAEAMLGENYLGKVNAGDPVMVVLANSNDSIKATVSYVGQSVDNLSRAFKVQVKLPNSNKLHPNMSCIMKIANYTSHDAIVVPIAMVQKTGEGSMVYVAEGTKAKAVPVTTGRISNGNVEILSGLNVGDQLITAGFEEMENGQNISIVQ